MPNVTREEMEKARATYSDARSNYSLIHHRFLTTVLKEAGVHEKLVELKDSKLRGQFHIASENYNNDRPWTIRFFPVRTTYGGISMKSKHIPNFYPWEEDTLVQQLKDICEVVGDLP